MILVDHRAKTEALPNGSHYSQEYSRERNQKMGWGHNRSVRTPSCLNPKSQYRVSAWFLRLNPFRLVNKKAKIVATGKVEARSWACPNGREYQKGHIFKHDLLIRQSSEQKDHKMLRLNKADVTCHLRIRRCNFPSRLVSLSFFLLIPVVARTQVK